MAAGRWVREFVTPKFSRILVKSELIARCKRVLLSVEDFSVDQTPTERGSQGCLGFPHERVVNWWAVFASATAVPHSLVHRHHLRKGQPSQVLAPLAAPGLSYPDQAVLPWSPCARPWAKAPLALASAGRGLRLAGRC
jgi:hypothetical protein